MKRRAKNVRWSVLACIAAALSMVALGACGDEEETQTITYTVTDQGKGTKVEGPASAETGLAEIILRNKGKGQAHLQLVRITGDHSPAEAIKAFETATEGKPFPAWFFAAGGISTTQRDENQTVTQVLKPGTYYAFDTEGNETHDPKSLQALEVSGEESDEEIEGDATVSAVEYGFEAEDLRSGKLEIDFENDGAQPHHLVATPLVDGSTAKDVEKFFKTNKGTPPLEEEGTQSTTVLEGGEGQAVMFDLEPGRYAFYCFITDRKGGQPHALKGMVDEFEVK